MLKALVYTLFISTYITGSYGAGDSKLPYKFKSTIERLADDSIATQVRSCKDQYSDLYNKNTLKIDIYYGYSDSQHPMERDKVRDPALKKDLVRQLTSTCKGTHQVCGFKQTTKDQFVKYVTGNYGQSVKVIATVKKSALTSSFKKNWTTLRQQQDAKSKQLEQHFLHSLSSADILLYSGHARYGSGMGFSPILKYSSDWWKRGFSTPFITKIYNQIQSNKTFPKIVGLFCCNSENYYGHVFSEKFPASTLILSHGNTVFSDHNRAIFLTLNALLTRECKDDLQDKLSTRLKRDLFTVYKSTDRKDFHIPIYFQDDEDIFY